MSKLKPFVPFFVGLRDCARAAPHRNPQDGQDALAATSSADKTNMDGYLVRRVGSVSWRLAKPPG